MKRKVLLDVPDELCQMAYQATATRIVRQPVEIILMEALRLGLAHLLVLEEEEAKWKMLSN